MYHVLTEVLRMESQITLGSTQVARKPAHESSHSTAKIGNPVGAKSNMAGSHTKFHRVVMCTHKHVRIVNLSRHSIFEELPVCVSLFPFLSFSPTPPQPTCDGTHERPGEQRLFWTHYRRHSTKMMSRAQNWPFPCRYYPLWSRRWVE